MLPDNHSFRVCFLKRTISVVKLKKQTFDRLSLLQNSRTFGWNLRDRAREREGKDKTNFADLSLVVRGYI